LKKNIRKVPAVLWFRIRAVFLEKGQALGADDTEDKGRDPVNRSSDQPLTEKRIFASIAL
jgi:hypothetical protein